MKLQGWFVGHATLLLCVSRYGLSYITFNYYSKWAQFSYRLAFVSAVATYGIVVFKAYRSRFKQGVKPQQVAFQLLADENVQYLRKSSSQAPGIQANNVIQSSVWSGCILDRRPWLFCHSPSTRSSMSRPTLEPI
jgi:hypothetical protein